MINSEELKQLEKDAIKKGKEMASELYNDPDLASDRKIVGAESEDFFYSSENEYEIKIWASWEDHKWFDYSVKLNGKKILSDSVEGF